MPNRQVILVNRPEGIAQASDFAIAEAEVPALRDGEIRVANHFLSVEPAMRGWIADLNGYAAPVPIGSVMRALAVGEIIESRSADHRAGEQVVGWFGWQEIATVPASAVVRTIRETDLPGSLALGVLGINGVTAHLGLTRIGQPVAGETVVVSTAAGAVGSAVGQIANILGCRTVGIAGGPAKAALCTEEFGYAHGIDYRSPGLSEAVAAACPDGVNVYFDNTAGAISDAVMPHLALRARVVVCGTASIDRWSPWPVGPRVERHLLTRRARMEGFVVFDWMADYEASVAQLAEWVRAGRLHYREEVLDGIEACRDALAGLYRGENTGKRIVRIA